MAKKVLYFDSQCGNEAYALTEDDKLVEYNFEPIDNGNIVGNIYKGKVTNVLNGMQAAFINCGLERNCYISVEDLFPDHNAYDGTEIDIPKELNLKVGDEIMVQVVKAPIAKKGAKVTTNISFVGKYTIYMPTTNFVGVSRKISDTELRKTLIKGASLSKKDNEGIIVRTAAPYAVRADKKEEIEYFRKLYQSVKQKFKTAPVGKLLYSDYPMHMRVLRDTQLHELDKIVLGNACLEDDVASMIKLAGGRHRVKVETIDEGKDMFYETGIYEQILEMMQPRVPLDNGANLMIERTEALTVIDVNTGKFIGDDSLEHTVYYTNILAAREIARQVRLRNIGGIFVVDFIDMDDTAHQKALVAELEKALANDKAKCNVLPMTKLGLVEFTRKRIGVSPVSKMTTQCRTCQGAGYTRTAEFIMYDVRAKLLNLLSKGNRTISIDINFDTGNKFINNKLIVDDLKAKYPQARVYVTLHRTYREDTATFRAETAPTITLPEGTVLLY